MKRLTALLLALAALACACGSAFFVRASALPPSLQPELPFSDVSRSDPCYHAVVYTYETGMIRGTSETEFSPKRSLTRAMFVTILHRAEWCAPAPSRTTPFRDVGQGRYYYDAVLWATQNGVTNGKSETRFCPNGSITREQLVTMVYRYVCAKGLESETEPVEKPEPADRRSVSAWAGTAMDWAYGRDFLPVETAEDGGILLNPKRNATRAETAMILANVLEPLGIPDQTMGDSSRACTRQVYKDLSDAEYANFRPVRTAGMAENRLYRSSSPLSSYLMRSGYAMAAMEDAGIRAVVNFSDTKQKAEARASYEGSYYSRQSVAYCYTPVSFLSDEFRDAFRDALRFIAREEGPYLIHCMEGKDRTGVVCAVLECLMGATYGEVFDDYVRSHENYFYVAHGTHYGLTRAQYKVLESRISRYLTLLLETDDPVGDDLQWAAEHYILGLGVTEEELEQIKAHLGG